METDYIILASIVLFLTAFLLYSIRFTKFKRLDAYSFVCMFYAFSAFCSFVFYNASNGFFRDYHNITIPPAIYWNFCILQFPDHFQMTVLACLLQINQYLYISKESPLHHLLKI